MNVKKLSFMALLIALCFIGSFIFIPSTTIGFDSMAGYFGGYLFGLIGGGTIGAIGHLITALLKGFPLGLPSHIIIAITMFISVAATAVLSKKIHFIIGIIIGTILNGLLAPLLLIPLKLLPIAALKATILFLIPISFANIVLAFIVYQAIKNIDIIKQMNPYY